MGLSLIGFEDEISVSYYHHANRLWRFGITSSISVCWSPFMIKDETEIATIHRSLFISDQAFHDTLDFIKPGKTEIEIANFLDFRKWIRRCWFVFWYDSRVVSTLLKPHAHPMLSVELGEAITMDFWVPLWPLCQWVWPMPSTLVMSVMNKQKSTTLFWRLTKLWLTS